MAILRYYLDFNLNFAISGEFQGILEDSHDHLLESLAIRINHGAILFTIFYFFVLDVYELENELIIIILGFAFFESDDGRNGFYDVKICKVSLEFLGFYLGVV